VVDNGRHCSFGCQEGSEGTFESAYKYGICAPMLPQGNIVMWSKNAVEYIQIKSFSKR
jgi:hypothetical protein